MRDYAKIARIVKEQGEAIIEKRAARSRLIRRISLSVSGIAASAAVLFCVWQSNDISKPSHYPGPGNIISDMTTSVTPSNTDTTTSAVGKTTNTKKISVTTTKTEYITTVAAETAITSAASVQVSAHDEPVTTALKCEQTSLITSAVSSQPLRTIVQTTAVTDKPAETVTTVYDYSTYYIEGKSFMNKKFTALSAAITIAASGLSPFTANASNHFSFVQYDPVDNHTFAEQVEWISDFIEKYDVDLDVNSDNKVDVFDFYALFRYSELNGYSVELDNEFNYHADCPDYIIKNCDVLYQKLEQYCAEYPENEIDTTFGFEFYFLEKYPIKLDYFVPDFYIDNCPDTYFDPIPAEYIRRDTDVYDIIAFNDSKYYTNGDGFTPLNLLYAHSDEAFHAAKSPMHQFIERLTCMIDRFSAAYDIMDQLIKEKYIDPDINSDGVFDIYDISLLMKYYDYGYERPDNYFNETIFNLNRTYEYYYNSIEEKKYTLTESEWKKAVRFFDVSANYFRCDFQSYRFLFIYYVTNYKVDPDVFDSSYYSSNDIYIDFFLDLRTYKDISETYGVNKIREPRAKEPDLRFTSYLYNIDEMFPQYYADVKSGKLPQPDINNDGKVDIADYAYFTDLFAELPRDDYPPYIIYCYIEASDDIRERFNNDFDFNGNGVSVDCGELECIQLYIANEMQVESSKDIKKALEEYYAENPEVDPMTSFHKQYKEIYGISDSDEETFSGNAQSEQFQSIQFYMDNLDFFKVVEGDANNDGNVTFADTVAIMQSIANPDKYGIDGSAEKHLTEKGKKAADVDSEPGLTLNDARVIMGRLTEN